MACAFTAGIDVGSSTVKLVVLDGDAIQHQSVADATAEPAKAALGLLERVPSCSIVATGYGRDLLELKRSVPTISEIKAHAMGARFMFPACTAVVDIGGQDLKVTGLDGAGKVARFELNDRCAAGTGKFLEIMAHRLGYSLEDFAAAALAGSETITISAMCTVFAESEVVGLLNRGHGRGDIARALHHSVVKRIAAMFKRTEPRTEAVVATGGGALNNALVTLLAEALAIHIQAAPDPQIVGALGCALHARAMQGG